jgi:hypothetical protein
LRGVDGMKEEMRNENGKGRKQNEAFTVISGKKWGCNEGRRT